MAKATIKRLPVSLLAESQAGQRFLIKVIKIFSFISRIRSIKFSKIPANFSIQTILRISAVMFPPSGFMISMCQKNLNKFYLKRQENKKQKLYSCFCYSTIRTNKGYI